MAREVRQVVYWSTKHRWVRRRLLMNQPTTPSDSLSEQEREARRQEQIRRNQAALEMLENWDQEDPEEQRETLAFLMRVLDEDRPSYRKLFS